MRAGSPAQVCRGLLDIRSDAIPLFVINLLLTPFFSAAVASDAKAMRRGTIMTGPGSVFHDDHFMHIMDDDFDALVFVF
jgi:hypothetical protein